MTSEKKEKQLLVTVGTINNFSNQLVQDKYQVLLDTIKNSKTDTTISNIIYKLEKY